MYELYAGSEFAYEWSLSTVVVVHVVVVVVVVVVVDVVVIVVPDDDVFHRFSMWLSRDPHDPFPQITLDVSPRCYLHDDRFSLVRYVRSRVSTIASDSRTS